MDIYTIQEFFSNVTNSFLGIFPTVIKALILLLISWLLANLARKLVKKLLGKAKFLDKLNFKKEESNSEQSGADEIKKLIDNIGQFVYFIVFLLFLPSIFDTLDMGSAAAPISNMMNSLLGFIPKLLAFVIIIFIGNFIAKLLRDLTYQFLTAINIDKWFNKVKPSNEEDANLEYKEYKLADVLSKLAYGLVLIPFIAASLEALKISILADPILLIINKIVGAIPNIFVAIILLVFGYYLAQFVSSLLEELLEKSGIEKIYNIIDKPKNPDSKFNLSKIIAFIVKIVIMLFITVEALSILQLNVLNTIGYVAIAYLPRLISGAVIIITGVYLGIFVEKFIKKYSNNILAATIVKYILIVFSAFMTLEQIQFATSTVNTAFLLILGALAVAFAISFGIGGRDFAKRQLEKFEKKLDEEKKEDN